MWLGVHSCRLETGLDVVLKREWVETKGWRGSREVGRRGRDGMGKSVEIAQACRRP